MQTTNSETQEVYTLKKRTILLIFIMASFSLLVGFIVNYSLEDKVLSLLNTSLRKNGQCPIFYKSAQISYLLPKVTLKDIEISSRCLKSQEGLFIENAKFSLGLPAIAPIGMTFNTEIKKIGGYETNITAKSIHNFSSQYIRIEDSIINLGSFEPILNKFKLDGSIQLNAFVGSDLKTIKDLDLYILSKNLVLPTQTIQNFELPSLAIGNFSLKAHSEEAGNIDIQELIIGNELSPIRAQATGSININAQNFANSKFDLRMQVKFSTEFIEQFSIINLVLGDAKQDEQGFYHMRIGGLLSRPNTPQMINP